MDAGGTIEARHAGIVCGGDFQRLVEAARMLLEDDASWRSYEQGARAWWQDRVAEESRMAGLMRAIALRQDIP